MLQNNRPTHPLTYLTWTAKVDYLYGAPLGIAQQDVLRLQITVNDAEFRCREKEQRRAELLGKLPCKVEGDTSEVCVPQEVVEVIGQKFKHQTQMVFVHKVPP